MSETMNTGDVSRRLGVPVTVGLLTEIGFKPVGKDKRADLWAQSDYPAMADALAKYIEGRRNTPMQAKPAKVEKAKPASTAHATTGNGVDDDDDL